MPSWWYPVSMGLSQPLGAGATALRTLLMANYVPPIQPAGSGKYPRCGALASPGCVAVHMVGGMAIVPPCGPPSTLSVLCSAHRCGRFV